MFHNTYTVSPRMKELFCGREEEDHYREEQLQQEQLQQEAWKRLEEAKQIRYMRLYENPLLFLQTEGWIQYDPDGAISSQELYQLYRQWCITQKLPISTPRSFWLTVKDKAPEYAMTYCTICSEGGKRCRGFRGIRACAKQGTDDTDTA